MAAPPDPQARQTVALSRGSTTSSPLGIHPAFPADEQPLPNDRWPTWRIWVGCAAALPALYVRVRHPTRFRHAVGIAGACFGAAWFADTKRHQLRERRAPDSLGGEEDRGLHAATATGVSRPEASW